MASAVLGKVSPTPKGEYVSTQDYARLDVVTYEGYPYLAKSNVPSGNLPTDELYWMPLLTNLDFAPGGFGLGGYGIYCSDCNSATKNGWYRFDASTLNIAPSASQGSLFVRNAESSSGVIVYQTMWNGYWRAYRFYGPWDNTWTEWEFENPPMQLGVEYRTTERSGGAPVYAKQVYIGALPNNASKYTEALLPTNITPTAIQGVGVGGKHAIPIPSMHTYVSVDGEWGTLYVSTDSDYSNYGGYITVKYTKG